MIKLFYFCVIVLLSQPIFSQTLETDRLALIDLYNATNGPNWTNKTGWNVPGTPGDNPCSWYGVICSGGRVTSLNLGNNNLTGSIPISIENLTQLTNLDLHFNKLSNILPSEIGNLIKLTNLKLSFNQLSGSIPSSIGNLSNLYSLDLNSNQLTGIIPSSIGSLSHLYSLDLSFNQLNEAIPSSIGNLSTLQLFYLSSNQLSGNLPASICNLNNLIILQLGNNQLIGSIPINIGNLTRLLALSLENNQLSGSIPTTIKNLSNLEYLGLTANQLTGNIPDEIGNLLNLKSLSLRNNHFIGSFPEKILNLTNLEQLDLSENQFTGTIPIEIGKLTKLKWFRLFSNQFTGNIPASIGNLSSLNTLDLGSNQLKGSIPSSIGNLINLQWFFLEENQLTGNFNLSGIPAFATVILENNKFTFDGIESNVALIDSYSPQANLPLTNTAGVLSVNAGGTLTNNTYRWYKKNPTALVATNTGNANYTPNAAGTYFVQVTNNIATSLTLTSDDISVTLTNTPIFTTQPSNVTVCPNTGTSFTATATNAVSYQWQVKIGAADFANLNEGGVYANVTSSTLSISNAAGLNGYQYRCVAIGTEGGTNSETATLTVGTPQATLNLQSPEDDITAASPTKNALNISAANKIQANGKVIYQGAQSVVLRPGFEAQAGSTFTAQIGGCN